MGYVCVNPHALICARILSRDRNRPVDAALLEERLRASLALRDSTAAVPYYRWVFGESDLLPGLVLDRYGDVVVGQIATAGMQGLEAQISTAVRKVLAPACLYWKNDSGARDLEHLPKESSAAFGPVPDELQVREGGLAYTVSLPWPGRRPAGSDQIDNRESPRSAMCRPGRGCSMCVPTPEPSS